MWTIAPRDWPLKVRHSPLGNFDPHVTWLNQNVGQKGVDWDLCVSTYSTSGYWLFARESDAVAFVLTWL